MILYHYTPISRVESILREGLDPNRGDGRGATNTPGVYMVEDGDDRSAFIAMLYGEPAARLAVDVTDLPLTSGDDDEPDRPEYAVQAWIEPARITLVSG